MGLLPPSPFLSLWRGPHLGAMGCGVGIVDFWPRDIITEFRSLVLYTSIVIAFLVSGGEVATLYNPHPRGFQTLGPDVWVCHAGLVWEACWRGVFFLKKKKGVRQPYDKRIAKHKIKLKGLSSLSALPLAPRQSPHNYPSRRITNIPTTPPSVGPVNSIPKPIPTMQYLPPAPSLHP
ncbi:hypothetical protein HOY80DRAFT_645431 [Tuber brumale]|nr:hypothetical protein HOY80DRAFT_645431 [Tuber brumale]